MAEVTRSYRTSLSNRSVSLRQKKQEQTERYTFTPPFILRKHLQPAGHVDLKVFFGGGVSCSLFPAEVPLLACEECRWLPILAGVNTKVSLETQTN